MKGEYCFDGGPFDALRFWVGGSDYRHNERGRGDDGFGIRATFKNREVEGRSSSSTCRCRPPSAP